VLNISSLLFGHISLDGGEEIIERILFVFGEHGTLLLGLFLVLLGRLIWRRRDRTFAIVRILEARRCFARLLVSRYLLVRLLLSILRLLRILLYACIASTRL
jgi:hypothetical protein